MSGEPVSREGRKPFNHCQPVPLASACTAEAPKSPFDVMWPRGPIRTCPLGQSQHHQPTDTSHPSATTCGMTYESDAIPGSVGDA